MYSDWSHTANDKLQRKERKGRTKNALLSLLGYTIGAIGSVVGFLLMVVVGGAIIYGFVLALGLVYEVLLG